MVTGSHNAAEYNGFKMCLDKAALYGEDIQELKRLVETGTHASGSGTVSTASVIPPYLRYLKEHFAGVDGKGSACRTRLRKRRRESGGKNGLRATGLSRHGVA